MTTVSEQSIWNKTFIHSSKVTSIPLKITIAFGLIGSSMMNVSQRDDNIMNHRKGVTSYHFEYDDIVEKEGAAMGNRAFNDELVSRHELEKTELLFDQKTKNLDDKINHLNSDMNNQFAEVNKKLDAIIAEIRELPTKDYVDKQVSAAIIEATKQHIDYTDKKINKAIGVIGVLIALGSLIVALL